MKGEDMLSNRQRDILKAIIEEYINTAEPVSSAAILERYGLNCSSATIRNDMSELEGLGYLEKPHTSAGRIPSVKGYRFYVDELLNDENITLEEIDYIKQNLQTKVNEIEDLTKITTNTISEMTHYTTVAIGPDYYDEGLQSSEVFAFDPNTASQSDFQRLGLESWQARNIIKYRNKGGIFRTPRDFARVYGLTKKQFEKLLQRYIK